MIGTLHVLRNVAQFKKVLSDLGPKRVWFPLPWVEAGDREATKRLLREGALLGVTNHIHYLEGQGT